MYNDYEVENQDFRKQSGRLPSDRRRHHRKSRSEDSDEGAGVKKRRIRGHGGQFRDSSNDDTPVTTVKTKQMLTIGDSVEVDKFYRLRFKDCQQSACKIMGKSFVKLVEPKKQTHHPYTKGAEQAPPWWPPTTGENHVRHKEPDHLLKPGKLLLIH